MFSYSVYKVVHLLGVMMVLLSLGGLAASGINSITKANNQGRRILTLTHGLGMLISLVGGFGLLARLGVAHDGLPGWIIAKLCIWIVFGAFLSVLYRKPEFSKLIWFLIIIFSGAAAYLAGSKPF